MRDCWAVPALSLGLSGSYANDYALQNPWADDVRKGETGAWQPEWEAARLTTNVVNPMRHTGVTPHPSGSDRGTHSLKHHVMAGSDSRGVAPKEVLPAKAKKLFSLED